MVAADSVLLMPRCRGAAPPRIGQCQREVSRRDSVLFMEIWHATS